MMIYVCNTYIITIYTSVYKTLAPLNPGDGDGEDVNLD